MSISLPNTIFQLRGQVVNGVEFDKALGRLVLNCQRDKRYKVIDPKTGQPATINRYTQRYINGLPICGHRCVIKIELAEVRNKNGDRRIEESDFVQKGCYYTKQFCQLVSGLCRHMSIQAVSKHFALRWETTKNIDKSYLQSTLPALEPENLKDLKYIGVDEVARAKGHDYMTVVYDLVSGQLIWVHEGRNSEAFSIFLRQLPETTKQGVLGVAMDMGPCYQKSVKDELPHADIIFDRFHVMQHFSRAIDNQRRVDFRQADDNGKNLIKGTRYLLLRNKENLNEAQETKLNILLSANENMNTMYILKEQLQALWTYKTYPQMADALENWCQMAEKTNMIYIKKYVKSLRYHKEGICNYAKHPFTTAKIEAGNVGIGMIRKRARGIKDTEYFKLKIRQLGTPEQYPMFYFSTA